MNNKEFLFNLIKKIEVGEIICETSFGFNSVTELASQEVKLTDKITGQEVGLAKEKDIAVGKTRRKNGFSDLNKEFKKKYLKELKK